MPGAAVPAMEGSMAAAQGGALGSEGERSGATEEVVVVDIVQIHVRRPDEPTAREVCWALLSSRVLRLAFKRRQWSNLGAHLKDVKNRGRSA